MIHTLRDDARQRLTITASGVVSFGDLVTAVERQRAEEIWHYGLLYDLRGATTDVTAGDIRDLASHVEHFPATARRGPVAVIATDPLLFSLAHIYAALTAQFGIQFRPFPDIEEATAWLDTMQSDRNR